MSRVSNDEELSWAVILGVPTGLVILAILAFGILDLSSQVTSSSGEYTCKQTRQNYDLTDSNSYQNREVKTQLAKVPSKENGFVSATTENSMHSESFHFLASPTPIPSVPGVQIVNGYHRKDGAYVEAYARTTKDSSTLNNWSHIGNINPVTGVRGGRR